MAESLVRKHTLVLGYILNKCVIRSGIFSGKSLIVSALHQEIILQERELLFQPESGSAALINNTERHRD